MSISPIISENDEEQSLPPFHQRLAGFCLILAVEGRHKHQTLLNVAKLAIIEHEERKLKQDRKMTVAELVEYFNKSLLSPPPTVYQVASEIKEQFLFDSIKFTFHGGFRKRKIQNKAEYECRPDCVVNLEKEVHGIGLIRKCQNLGLEGLQLINDRQYCDLMNSKRSLENQLSKYGNDSLEWSKIQIKLQEIELCRAAYLEWFLNNGYDTPVVEVPKLEGYDKEENQGETVFSHSDNYRTINFKGVEYHVTPNQADAIKILDEAGIPLDSKRILAKVYGAVSGNKTVRGIFSEKKGGKKVMSPLWEMLIVKVRRDMYRLNK